MILLCSNGLTSQELLREAKKQAKNGKKAALVVTADPEYKEKNYHVPRNVKELEFLGLSVELFDFDKDPAEKLFSYDVVCLMGGNPYYLLHSIREHHGEEALQAVAENRLLIGWSAGALVLGPTIKLIDLYHPQLNFMGLTDLTGLGLTQVQLMPHCNKEDPQKALDYRQKTGGSVICVKDGEGVLLEASPRKISPQMCVSVAGVDFSNPLIAASGTFGFGREYHEFYPLSVLGGISCKGTTIRERPGNPPPRVTETPGGMLNAVGLQNPGVDHFIQHDLPWLAHQGTRIIANVAGNAPEDYCETVEKLNDTPVDMIELNISCPNVKQGGVQFGTTCEGVYGITSQVKKHCKKPLMVKLSPNVTDISEMAVAAEHAGADAVSLINTLTGMRIDIHTRRPILHNNTGGLSGPALLPVALRMVWQTAQKVKIPIVGLGGISTWQDAVEMLLAGATALQIGTALFTDPYAPLKIWEGLFRYLEENKIKSLSELTGGVRPW